MPRTLDKKFVQKFEDKLFSLFPDVKTNGQVTRTQILDTMRALKTHKEPIWIKRNRIGWGIYQVPSVAKTIKKNINTKPEVVAPAFEDAKEVETAISESNITSAVSTDVDLKNIKSMIPLRDKNYVAWGNFNDVEQVVKSGQFYPVFVTGPTRNGKTQMFEQCHAKQKKPLIRVNIRETSDEDKLIGSKTLVDGNIQIVYGPVLLCMMAGVPILLDEIDAGQANALMCLQPILEGKPYYFALKNEWVYPQPGFNIYATGNTKGKGSDDGRYIGTNVLNEAFLERFAATFEQEYPPIKIEAKIVRNYMQEYNCMDEVFCDNLVRWADIVRKTYAEGAIDETITTGRLVHIVRAFSIFKNKTKAIEVSLNRFDSQTKGAFLNTFEKVSVEVNDVITPEGVSNEDEPIQF